MSTYLLNYYYSCGTHDNFLCLDGSPVRIARIFSYTKTVNEKHKFRSSGRKGD